MSWQSMAWHAALRKLPSRAICETHRFSVEFHPARLIHAPGGFARLQTS